jgi:hypothetical protein
MQDAIRKGTMVEIGGVKIENFIKKKTEPGIHVCAQGPVYIHHTYIHNM